VNKLSIPVERKSTQIGPIKDVKIDYAENWQRRHWRTLQAAYNNSPYFLYYQDELYPFYEKRFEFLVDFNTELLTFLLNKLKINSVRGTGYEVRGVLRGDLAPRTSHLVPYQQVFPTHPFVPNLSSFDLLFNCGPESKSYLCKA
jgi:hypothetical protein